MEHGGSSAASSRMGILASTAWPTCYLGYVHVAVACRLFLCIFNCLAGKLLDLAQRLSPLPRPWEWAAYYVGQHYWNDIAKFLANNKRATASDKWGKLLCHRLWLSFRLFVVDFLHQKWYLCCHRLVCVCLCVWILCPFSQSRLGHQKQAVPHLPQLQSSQHAPNDLLYLPPSPARCPYRKRKEKKTIYWKLWCNVQSEFDSPHTPYVPTLPTPCGCYSLSRGLC